jgi:broad specificity phosphatase PhoE
MRGIIGIVVATRRGRFRAPMAARAVALLVTLGVAVTACRSGAPAPEPESAAEDASTVFLVRHAETLYPPPGDAPRDPPLNRLGRERASRLAEVLRDAGLTSILSTDLRRTRQTAGLLAERLGLEIEPYDPTALAALAARLAAAPGRILVSGHSNTTPELVRLLGGDPGGPIDEKTEFDRLYVVTFAPGQPPSTLLLHYGAPPGTWPPADPAALAEP